MRRPLPEGRTRYGIQSNLKKQIKMEEAAEAEIQDGEIVQKSESEDNSSKKLTDTIDSLTLEFTCTICQELFVEARTLQCAHTFCAHCLDGWLKRNSRSLRRSCPICRRRVETKGFPSIVLDSAIDKMIDTVGGEQKERRLELKRSREEQKQEEDPFDDSHIMPTGLQDGDASEQSDRNFRRNLIRASRRRRREQRERQGSTQSSRYGFLRPPFFVPASDTEEIFDFSDAPSTPVISFPLDRSDEVPVEETGGYWPSR